MPEPIVWKGLAIIIGVGIGYVLILRIAANLVYPYREELFSLGDEILNHHNTSNNVHDIVCHALRNAMTYRAAFVWLFGVFVFAYLAVSQWFVDYEFQTEKVPADLAPKLKRFYDLYFWSIFAANPLVGTIAFIFQSFVFVLAAIVRPLYPEKARAQLAEYTANHLPV